MGSNVCIDPGWSQQAQKQVNNLVEDRLGITVDVPLLRVCVLKHKYSNGTLRNYVPVAVRIESQKLVLRVGSEVGPEGLGWYQSH